MHTNYSFHCFALSEFVVWTFSSPISKSLRLGCLPLSLYTLPTRGGPWLGITTASGFPEFDRFCIASFLTCSPLQSCRISGLYNLAKSSLASYQAAPPREYSVVEKFFNFKQLLLQIFWQYQATRNHQIVFQ